MNTFSIVVLLVILCSSYLSNASETGYTCLKEGIRLLEDKEYMQASHQFWKAVITHNESQDYSVSDAFQMFLISYQRQGKLAAGYAFVAASMHETSDNRKLEYLKMAYKEDPHDPDVIKVMRLMGETPESMGQSRRYKEDIEVEDKGGTCQNEQECQMIYEESDNIRDVESGWNDQAVEIYLDALSKTENKGIRTVRIPPLGPFSVTNHWFWPKVNSWESTTFEIFSKYITNETIAVDFGAWIGPTLFYHAQLSKKSYAMEADPSAYAQLERNVVLNPQLEKKIHIVPVAVSTYKDAGILTMSSSDPGNSMSEIGVMRDNQAKISWNVRGYPLFVLFQKWGIDISVEPVFIKVDIESYECMILPSWYDWLIKGVVPRHLTIFVSFHPQVEHCTRNQMQQVFKLLQLFDTITCGEKQKMLPLSKLTTFNQFEQLLDDMDCLTNKENSDFVLDWKREHIVV